MAAGKKKNSLALSKENATSASAIERQSGVESEAVTTHDSPKLPVSKRKHEVFNSSN